MGSVQVEWQEYKKHTYILDMNVDTLGPQGPKFKQLKMEKNKRAGTARCRKPRAKHKKELWDQPEKVKEEGQVKCKIVHVWGCHWVLL